MGETISDVLRRVIAKQAHLDPSLVTPGAPLSQLGVTSLVLVYKTVADLIDLGRSLGLEGRSRAT